MSDIHPTAIVDSTAKIADNVRIGPYAVIGPGGVVLDRDVEIKAHVCIEGDTHIGTGTVVYPFASIGTPPQDLKFHGEKSRLRIGAHNVIREHVTMNPGTEGGGMETRIGDHGLFMIGAHVAHDCRVGNHVILANNATLAGHVHVGDYAIIGGLSAARQFVRIGAHAMIGGMTGVENDVIPYGMAVGERAHLAGLNLVGLDRRGFDKSEIQDLRRAFKQLFEGEGTLGERVASVSEAHAENSLVQTILGFIAEKTALPLCQPKAS